MEVDEAKQKLLEGGRLLAGLEEVVAGDGLQIVGPLHVCADALRGGGCIV